MNCLLQPLQIAASPGLPHSAHEFGTTAASREETYCDQRFNRGAWSI
jgi:hypothetical protein